MARKPSRIRRTFTPQFKKDAVALVAGGRSVNEVAHDLGIARSLLQRWKIQLAREPDLPTAFPGAGRLAPQAEQLRQLQQRFRAVTEERDILKKPWRTSRTTRSEVPLHRSPPGRVPRPQPLSVLGVSPSGLYRWTRPPAPRQSERNDALLVHIQAAYTASRRTYGAPRIHHQLRAQGVAAGRHRIARLMRREGIVACTERRFRWTATARAELPAAPDRLRRDFTAPAPNQRWASDITSVRTGQGWLHLAIVLDLYARRIVGWAMAPTLDQQLAADALAMALADRRPAPGLLVHSDRGGPYLATRVQQQLAAHRAIASTSRPGRCLDNAVAESFFHTLKTELVYQHRYRTREEARLAIFEYIAAFYNRTRRHSSNDYRSPDEHEAQYAGSRT
jgi:putative transposase